MNILSLLDKFLNNDENGLIVNSDYCVRLKSPMASCYECINKCPEFAIEITDSFIKISDKCTHCKVCFNICPNYVFDIKKGLYIDDLALIKKNNAYYFCCKYDNNVSSSENIKKSANKFNKNDNSYDNIDDIINKLSCINEIDDVDIISHLKNNKNIFFITGDCESCKNISFYNSKIKKIDKISGFLGKNNKIHHVNFNSSDFDRSIFYDKITDKITIDKYNQNSVSDDMNTMVNNKYRLQTLKEDDLPDGIKSSLRRRIAKSANEVNQIRPSENSPNSPHILGAQTPDDGLLAREQSKKPVNRQDGSGTSNTVVERRLFFKEIGKTIKKHATGIAEEFSVEDLPIVDLFLNGSGKDNKRINKLFYKKRKKLFSFLKTNEDCLAILEIKLPKFNKNCVFCGNCWEFCPTEALRYKNSNIVLEPYFCTACNLCKDLCSFGGISMRKVKCLKDISYEKILLTKQADWENY